MFHFLWKKELEYLLDLSNLYIIIDTYQEIYDENSTLPAKIGDNKSLEQLY